MGGLLRHYRGNGILVSPLVQTMAPWGERLANNTRRIKYESFRSILITVSPTNVEIFTISFAPIKKVCKGTIWDRVEKSYLKNDQQMN